MSVTNSTRRQSCRKNPAISGNKKVIALAKRFGFSVSEADRMIRDLCNLRVNEHKRLTKEGWPDGFLEQHKDDPEIASIVDYYVAYRKNQEARKKKRNRVFNRRYGAWETANKDVAIAVEMIRAHLPTTTQKTNLSKNLQACCGKIIGRLKRLNYCVDIQLFVPDGVPCPYCHTIYRYTGCRICRPTGWLEAPYGYCYVLTFWIGGRLFLYKVKPKQLNLLQFRTTLEDTREHPPEQSIKKLTQSIVATQYDLMRVSIPHR